jgi:hypothetical protein
MTLFVVESGTPVVVEFITLGNNKYASFPLDRPMVFEESNRVGWSDMEYQFNLNGRNYYIPAANVKVVK